MWFWICIVIVASSFAYSFGGFVGMGIERKRWRQYIRYVCDKEPPERLDV